MEGNVFTTIMIFMFIANNINCRTVDITDETFLDYSEYTGKDKDLSIDDGTCAEQVTPSMKEYNAVRIDKTKKLKKIVMERTLTRINSEYAACVNKAINFTLLREDIIESEYNIDIEMASKKHCHKVPDYLKCNEMYEYNVGMIPEGGTMGDRTRIRIAINEALITFICQQGNRIGLFYADSGLQCLMWKETVINQCMDTSFNKYGQSVQSSLVKMRFEDQCNAILDTQACIISSLSQCQNQIVAKFMNEWYDHFRRTTLCSQFKSVYRYSYEPFNGHEI